jgi:hypothetical protein
MKTHGAKEVQPKEEPETDKMEPGPVTNVGSAPHSESHIYIKYVKKSDYLSNDYR